MKKTLLLATALTASLAALAQNPIVPVEFPVSFLGYVPKAFADAPYLAQYEENDEGAASIKVYNHNLQLLSTIPVSRITSISVYNFDEEFLYQDEGQTVLTQTLFNSDSRFEYISRIEDGEGNCVRFDVVADDGTVISTFGNYSEAGERGYYFHINLFKIANTVYLRVWSDGPESIEEWYRIDRQTQSISRVEGLPFNVFPTVADRESTITVQFEDGATATELQVLDAQGRTVQRIPVAPGQQEVKVSTRGLRSGVGFIGDRRGGAAKIIVR